MILSLLQIYNLLDGNARLVAQKPQDELISTLICDSRELTFAPGTLFFALRTASADGHKYVPSLYERGVRNFVVEHGYEIPRQFANANFILVDSPKDALQEIGQGVREMFPDLVSVGITGSRGKTQIKEMIYELLHRQVTTVRSPRSFNSQIGVPLSLWELSPETKIGIFEAGISRPEEMSALERMIRPSVGVFTSLTGEHGENFTTLEEKAAEKAKLFSSAKVVIYPEDDDIILNALKSVCPQAKLIAVKGDNRQIAYAVAHEAAKLAGIDLPEGENALEVVSTRIDVLQALKDCLIIFDGFTHDLRSLSEALNFMQKRATPDRTSTVILGPIPPENGQSVEDVYKEIARMLKSKDIKRVIMVGAIPTEAENLLADSVERFDSASDSEDFMRKFSISDFDSELILIKGVRSQGFDEISSHLEAPRHETIMEVNLNALVHNYNYFKSKLRGDTSLITMVKADAYGVGALEVSKTMQAQGAAMLAVAVVDEGVALRQAGISMPIIVMNPMGTNYKALFDYRLEPSVFSLRELETLLRYAEIYDVNDYPVHIKLDTGMHRLGFLPHELDALIKVIDSQPRMRLRPASVFSHLATADCLDKDVYTDNQFILFTECANKLASSFPHPVKRHLLNTAGILRYNSYHAEMARLGIGLYGLSPLPESVNVPLQNVASLTTTIISLREWPEDTAIGYGRKGVTSSPSIIATIPIGYADGMDRRLGNGRATVRVNGVDCPTVGNICMDQCMIDVTNANAAIGDKVVVFDSQSDILRLAETLETIPYEILTSISPRVKRIYFRE